MRILYISRLNLRSQRAHVYNTLKTIAALNYSNARVTLLVVFKKISDGELQDIVWKTNKIDSVFPLVQLFSGGHTFNLSRFLVLRVFGAFLDNVRLMFYLTLHHREYEVVYLRDPLLWLTCAYSRYILRKPYFFESHFILTKGYTQWCTEYCVRNSRGTITIAQALEKYYKSIQPQITTIFCAAAEPERFLAWETKFTKIELRKKLHLPVNSVILGYSGNLYKTGNGDSYGIEDVISALHLMPRNIVFVGVGKRTDSGMELENQIKTLGLDDRVYLIPWVDKSEVAAYLLAADILLIPAAGAKPGNSPTKIFEYLIAGRPIIAASTEPISEILVDQKNALLVDYKNPEAWKKAVELLISHPEIGQEIVVQASALGAHFTWSGRASSIRKFIETSPV